MRTLVRVTLVLLVLVEPAAAKDAEPNFVERFLDGVSMGAPLQTDQVILIPLVRAEAPDATGVACQFDGTPLIFSEPEMPEHHHDFAVINPSDKPVLLVGGTVLLGGHRDRLVRYPVIVAPSASLEASALPAASSSETRKEAVPFTMAKFLAPLHLRRKADYGASSTLVPTFIARNLEFRDQGDERKSLAAIGGSKLLQEATAEARRKLDEVLVKAPPQGGTVVGVIAALRGRLQSLTLYDPALMRGYRESYVLGATYAAAALAIQAEKKNIPIPGKDDPEKTLATVTKDATKLFERLQKSKYRVEKLPDGAAGERLILQLTGGTRGRAVGLDGKLVHLAIYPHDPFASALYGSKIELPDDEIMSDPDRIGLVELGRQAVSGQRLTAAEQRLLSGVRSHSGGRGGMSKPGRGRGGRR